MLGTLKNLYELFGVKITIKKSGVSEFLLVTIEKNAMITLG